MKKLIILIYICLSVSLNLAAQCGGIMDTIITNRYYNAFTKDCQVVEEYRFSNNSSEEYVTWISQDEVSGKTPEELIHDYFQKVKGDFNLVSLFYENLLDNKQVAIGHTFMKIIKPNESFSYFLLDDNTSFYKDRIVIFKRKVVERQIRMKLNYEYSYSNHSLIINAEKILP